MSVRHIVFSLLSANIGLTAIVNTRIYDSGSLGTPTGKEIPAKPFLVTNYGPEVRGPDIDSARTFDRTVDVYFYSDPGDRTLIERGLRAVRSALHGTAGWFVDPADNVKTWLTSCTFQGGSGDLFDDVYRANTRFATYRLIGNTP